MRGVTDRPSRESAAPTADGRVVRAVRYVTSQWHEVAGVLSTGLALVASFTTPLTKPHWALVLSALAFLVTGAVFRARQTPSYSHLARDKAAADEKAAGWEAAFPGLIGVHLRAILEHALPGDSDARITLYVHNGSAFVAISRHSRNVSHKAMGRPAYPDDQGVIGDAWKSGDGQALRTGLPDFTKTPEDYFSALEKDSIDRQVAERLTMKSGSLVALRIDEQTPSAEAMAVVVIESLNPGGLGNSSASTVQSDETWTLLQRFVTLASDFLPDMTSAAEKGF